MTTWLVYESPHSAEVVPVDDWRDHDDGEGCWCHPDTESEPGIIVHRSLDGREAYERGELRPH